MTKVEHALALAARGFRVFPIKPGAKTPPLLNDWPNKATSDPETVKLYWLAVPDANIAIECSGLAAIDVDPKNGGDDSFGLLEVQHGWPATFTVRTPSGGRHVYYKVSHAVGNSVGALAPGIDVRGTAGYCLAPGSTVPSGEYTIENDLPVADAPEWLVQKLGTFTKPEQPAERKVDNAPDAVVKRAQDWLVSQLPAIEGVGGDLHTFRVICGLRDMGVSAEQALDVLGAWNATCAPPWAPEDLAVKVANAYRYGQNEPGARAALPSDFPVVVPESGTNVPKKGTRAKRLSEFAASEHKGPGYLVKGVLQRRSYAELFGAPGEGKTFIALDLAYHVAAGAAWMGHNVHQGPVLYLAYEGIGGMVKRAQALRRKYGEADVPLFVAGASYDLRSQAGRQELGATMAEQDTPVLIVIDTFARALMGGDENSAQDVGAFNSAVAALIEKTGACVMIVHHSGKNKSAGARGSSALLGAIDTELEVDGHMVSAKKQRDIELISPIGFKLVPMIVGTDEDGDDLTSCVVQPSAVSAQNLPKLGGNAARAFEALCELAPDNAPVAEHKWRTACSEFLSNRRNSFYDIKRTLSKKGYIEVAANGTITRSMT